MSSCYGYSIAGELGWLPGTAELAGSGVETFPAGSDADARASESRRVAAITGGATPTVEKETTPPIVCLGTGLAPVTRKMIDRIRAGEYVDFAELPPARGKARPPPQALEGQVVVVHAADLLQSRKVIPDFATWSQCFAIYVAVVATHQPKRVTDLMAYQSVVARASLKYKWPSWVVYDQNFRQEAAGQPELCWAKVEPSMYTQCFAGQERTVENWCSKCQELDHTTANCPFQTRKRTWSAANAGAGSQQQRGQAGGPLASRSPQQVCLKFNRYQGDCRFGKECRFQHVCSSCMGPHPVSRCTKKQAN